MMSAYESRIRAWAKDGGMSDFLTAPIGEVENFMHERGIMTEFYKAFPDYEKRGET